MKKTLSIKLSYLFLLSENTTYKIEEGDLVVYLVNNKGILYVGIPYNKKEINDKFVGIQVTTETINYDHFSLKCLCLSADKEVIDKEKFLVVAEDFSREENRTNILNNPYSWIDKRKNLFGDSLSKKLVYDILGELISLKLLFSKDKTAKRAGPEGGTHDIVLENNIVEVKSTIKKRAYNVTINSSYQLSIEKETNLFFVRLEKKPHCLTINSLVIDLIQMGYPKEVLEKSLTKQGYGRGSRSREESYDLLGIYSYSVDNNNFPVFTIEQLNEKFAPKRNIVGFNLELDLSGIEHKVIYSKE